LAAHANGFVLGKSKFGFVIYFQGLPSDLIGPTCIITKTLDGISDIKIPRDPEGFNAVDKLRR